MTDFEIELQEISEACREVDSAVADVHQVRRLFYAALDESNQSLLGRLSLKVLKWFLRACLRNPEENTNDQI